MRKMLIITFLLFSLFLYSQQVIKLYNWSSNLSIEGNSYFDNFSYTIKSGDINNDGFQDLLISAPNADPNGRNSAGIVYIFLGKEFSEQQTNINLNSTEPDIKIIGAEPNDKLGTSIVCADINNDGFDDILLGAPFSSPDNMPQAGKLYILLGNSQFNSVYDLQDDSSYFCKINGEQVNQNFSTSIEILRFTDSSFPYIFISAPFSSFNNIEGCGIIYAVNANSIHSGSFDLNSATKIIGTEINQNIGINLSAGNIDDDAYIDIIIGSPFSDFNNITNCGKIYLLKGRSNFYTQNYFINDISNSLIIGNAQNSFIGNSISLSDVNYDNKADIIFFNNSNNSINVIFGSADLPETINLSSIEPDFKISSGTENILSSSFTINDYNMDGKNDFYIKINSNYSSSFYNEFLSIIFGSNDIPSSINIDNYEPDVKILAESFNEDFANSIVVSDINGDNINDVTLSAFSWQNNKGKSYTVFGGLPYIFNESPYDGQTDIQPNSNISFDLSDREEGIDINSVTVTIAGITYTKNDSNFIYSGNPNDYFILVNPNNNFGFNQTIDVIVSAKDFSNWLLPTEIYAFTTINDISPPFTANWSPAPSESGVSVDTDISFNIYDNGTGVDINSLNVSINDINYNLANNNINYSGAPDNYLIEISPENNFEYGQNVSVTINAADLASPPNLMDEFSYYFICNQDTIIPRIKNFYPDNEQNVGLNSRIEVTLVDNETGINEESISLLLDQSYNLIPDCNITTEDSLTIITYQPSLSSYYEYGLHTLQISFQDNANPPNTNQFSWNFNCIDDTNSPQIIEVFPLAYSNDNPTNTPFYLEITDDLTGINLNSLNILIDSNDIIDSPYTTVSPITNGYKILYNHPERFLGTINVSVNCSDNDVPPNEMGMYSYYFICTIDTIPPIIINPNPQENQQNVPINTDISLKITDDKTGLDMNTIRLFVNTQDVTQFTQISNVNSNTVSLLYNPENNFSFEDTVIVSVQASDLAIEPNFMDFTYQFVCEKDTDPPYITNEYPANYSTGVPIDTNIEFDLIDDGLGVNISSIDISMYVNNQVPYTIIPEINEIEYGYHLLIEPQHSFAYRDTVNLIISAEDNSTPPNLLNSFHYMFICEDDDTSSPFLFAEQPSKYSSNNPIDTPISFEILDKTSGIDFNSLIFKLNQIEITDYEFQEVTHNDSIGYYIYYKPEHNFSFNQTVYVNVFAIDLSSNHNIMNESYYFKTLKDTLAPIITTCFPQPNGYGYSNSNIFIKFYDSQSGINPKSFQLFLDNIPISNYTDSLFMNYYTVLYKNTIPYQENSEKTVNIYLEDNSGNFVDSTYTFFIKKDDSLPYINILKPVNSPLALNDTLIFDILDKGTGVDKQSINILLNNKLINNYEIIENPYTYNPDSLGYRIRYQISPPYFYPGQHMILKTQCSDFSQNEAILTTTFNILTDNNNKFMIIPKTITPNSDGWNDECRIIYKSSATNLNGMVYIYTLTGKLVTKLQINKLSSGEYESIWKGKYKNGKPVSSGLYIVKLKAKNKIYQGAVVVAH